MKAEQIIRAWKDEAFRDSLDASQRESLPENPAGLVELSEEDLGQADGGTGWVCAVTVTIIASCPACTQTVNCGSCQMATYGCCSS